MAVLTGGLGRRNGSSSSSPNRVLIIAPCILTSIGVLLVLYQVAWMYWLPGAFVPDTETISILEANADGSVTVKKKTVTRRHPDQLYTLDHLTGEKVPKYVGFVLCRDPCSKHNLFSKMVTFLFFTIVLLQRRF
jgi:hypothetical protein